MCGNNDCIHYPRINGQHNPTCLNCNRHYLKGMWGHDHEPDLYRVKPCKHMNDIGVCLLGVSSCGYCKAACSYFEQ